MVSAECQRDAVERIAYHLLRLRVPADRVQQRSPLIQRLEYRWMVFLVQSTTHGERIQDQWLRALVLLTNAPNRADVEQCGGSQRITRRAHS
jgi:hypothetical protein